MINNDSNDVVKLVLSFRTMQYNITWTFPLAGTVILLQVRVIVICIYISITFHTFYVDANNLRFHIFRLRVSK